MALETRRSLEFPFGRVSFKRDRLLKEPVSAGRPRNDRMEDERRVTALPAGA
jgi:hypothetical protein